MNQISEDDIWREIKDIRKKITSEELVSLNFTEEFIDSIDKFYWNKFDMFSTLVTKGYKQSQGNFLDLGGNGDTLWSILFGIKWICINPEIPKETYEDYLKFTEIIYKKFFNRMPEISTMIKLILRRFPFSDNSITNFNINVCLTSNTLHHLNGEEEPDHSQINCFLREIYNNTTNLSIIMDSFGKHKNDDLGHTLSKKFLTKFLNITENLRKNWLHNTFPIPNL